MSNTAAWLQVLGVQQPPSWLRSTWVDGWLQLTFGLAAVSLFIWTFLPPLQAGYHRLRRMIDRSRGFARASTLSRPKVTGRREPPALAPQPVLAPPLPEHIGTPARIGLAGIVSGGDGHIFLTQERRARFSAIIGELREFVADCTRLNVTDSVFKTNLLSLKSYYDIQPHLSDEFRAEMAKQRVTYLKRENPIPGLGQKLLDELARIEREWDLY